MDQLRNFADDRLLKACVYCGAGDAETRDHVPSRAFLTRPYPENLPVVPACRACNSGISADEEYVACLIECVLAGTTDPAGITRPDITATLRHAGALRARLESQRRLVGGQVGFEPEASRVARVARKLAAGHAAFELAFAARHEPTSLWVRPLDMMEPAEREEFDAPQLTSILGEVGSRAMQRMQVIEMTVQAEEGRTRALQFLLNDWVEVQEGRYRYFAADTPDGVIVRLVIAEYLAAEAWWGAED